MEPDDVAAGGAGPQVSLEAWGWDERWTAVLDAVPSPSGAVVARITGQARDRWTGQAEKAVLAVRRLGMTGGVDAVVGDWVLVTPGPSPPDPHALALVLPRRSSLSRGAAGAGSVEQVLAANVDVAWIVHGLDTPFNPRRLERYLAVAWAGGATPEVVLTKADLAVEVAERRAEVERVAIGVAVRTVSATDAESVARLRGALRPARTIALLGPSGAGKSTLVNRLAGGALAATFDVRPGDRKGRHTTTRRELFRLPGGALLLDTPGLRELRLWDVGDGIGRTFPEIEELASSCRFRDCAHEAEPGCAVLAAVEAGTLAGDRLGGFRKLRAEAAFQERRDDPRARAAAVSEHKTALKTLKHHQKRREQ